MEGVSDRKYKDYQGSHSSVLEVVEGNPLAAREGSRRSTPHLSLVWKEEGILARKKPMTSPIPLPQDSGRRKWFREYAERIGVIFTILGSVAFGAWYISKYDTRLENIETVVNGAGGLTDINRKLTEIGDRLTKIEGKLDAIDKYVLPYVLPRILGPKAVALGFTDPQIVPVQLAKSSAIHLLDKERSYNFTLMLQEVEKDHMKFWVDGMIGSVSLIYNTITIPKQIGVPINLMEVIGTVVSTVPKTPVVWAVILDFPSSDMAVFAFGLRNDVIS